MDYIQIHEKWQNYWRDNGINKFDVNSKKELYYCLEMFSYPSGASLHMGHYFNYAPCDTHARFKRMMGYNVFHPMGFDAFGLPAENHALKTNTHPRDNTYKNMDVMRGQLEKMGGMYDWSYSVTTCFPDYYKWTQWLFIQLFNAGLAYQKNAAVNWCDKCKTVLANEQVIGGECERCGSIVTRRNMKQWFFKITNYAEELLDGIDKLDWPNKTKVMQRNWIGKSTGAGLTFKTEGGLDIDVFTTRIDTLPGATFLVLAPEHALIKDLITDENRAACETYIYESSKKSEIDRQVTDREKTGVFTGSYAINPINGKKIPIYIADYVLSNYGTGAIMAVPAHDERDMEFAKKYKLPIIPVIDGEYEEAKEEMIKALKGNAKKTTSYRLRDWSFSRQRYWGCPIPIVHCDTCGAVAVPEKDLPVVLPYITDFKPRGAAPLENCSDFINCTCPKCGKPARREAETMDAFVDSSWYFLRYPYANLDTKPFEKDAPIVNKYIGGAEHACMHLLYARFITMFLHKQGKINFSEPFPSLVHQGMILAPDGRKMSKSKGNTITPDTYIEKYGSDILRLYMLFGFNYTEGGPWNDGTIKTLMRFTERVEKLITTVRDYEKDAKVEPSPSDLLFTEHNTVKMVRQDLDNFSFNTAVARCMELLNTIYDYLNTNDFQPCVARHATRTLVLLLAPMIPHLAEEFWEMLYEKPSVFNEQFPTPNEKYLVKNEIEIAVQINSKIVGRIKISPSATQTEIEKLCTDFTKGKKIEKVIYVKNRLINFLLSE